MTIPTTIDASGPYYPNGVTTNFPFGFAVASTSDVAAVLIASDGTEAVVDPSAYTIVLAEGDDPGGTLVFTTAPVDDDRELWVYLNPSFLQQIQFEDEGPFNQTILNRLADEAGLRTVWLRGQVLRALRVGRGQSVPLLDMSALSPGQILAYVGGKIIGVDNDPAEAAQSAVEAAASKVAAELARSQTATLKAETQVLKDQTQALKTGADAAAALAGDYFPGARSFVPQGAALGAGTITTAGTGGTNGTFALAFTGGNFATNPVGTFTVAGGVVTAINITGAGLYIGGGITKPTLSFAASAGLTGAAGTFNTVFLKTAGQYYLTDHATDARQISLFQNQSNAAVEIDASVDWLNFSSLDAVLAAATSEADRAQGYAALAFPEKQREDLEYDAAQRVKAAEVRPATWTPTRSISTGGNSLAEGTAANTTLHAAMTAIKTGVPTITFDFNVGGGTNMAAALAFLTANATVGQKAQDWVLVDPVLGENSTNNYDFQTAGETIANYESIVALQTGGAESVVLVTAPADGYAGRGLPHMVPDFWQLRKDIQTKSYAANFLDLRQHIIDWHGGRDGIDRTLREWNERPLAFYGAVAGATAYDLNPNRSEMRSQSAPVAADFYEGEGVFRNDAATIALLVKQGAFGAGQLIVGDGTHYPSIGNRVAAALIRDWDLGRQGFAPFIPPGYHFRCPENTAQYAAIGTVRMKGTADTVQIVSGDPLGLFALRNIGNQSFVLERTGAAAMKGLYKLLIVATKTVGGVTYQRSEFVRVFMTGSTAARVPAPVRFNKPFWIIGQEKPVTGAVRQASFWIRFKLDQMPAAPELANLLLFIGRGATNPKMSIAIGDVGRVAVVVYNAAGTLVLNTASRQVAFGGPVVTAGAVMDLKMSFDWNAGAAIASLNGVTLPFTGAGANFESVAADVDMNASVPIIGTSSTFPRAYLVGTRTWTGELTAFAMWWGQYFDWATKGSQLTDGSNDVITTSATYAIDGIDSHPFRFRGPAIDLFAGGPEAGYSIAPIWRPKDIYDV